jgi:tRNA pseudouridine38-40 synthase
VKNILFKIEYKGTNYSGWQVQPNATTIQKILQEVLQKICQCPVSIQACSRTDSGVHARGQVAATAIPDQIKLSKLFFSINSLLPGDVAVVDLVQVPLGFSIRSAIAGKRYIYKVLQSAIPRVFEAETHLWKKNDLNLDKATRAMNYLLGTHDFSAFRGKGCQQPTPIKTINRVDIKIRHREYCRSVEFIFEGSGFLKNMVRIMAGTLIDIAQGKIAETSVLKALASGNREDAGITAPAKGLILDQVFLRPDPFQLREMDSWDKR